MQRVLLVHVDCQFLQEPECLNDVLMIPMALHTYLQLAAPLLETPASPCQGPGDEGNTIIICDPICENPALPANIDFT